MPTRRTTRRLLVVTVTAGLLAGAVLAGVDLAGCGIAALCAGGTSYTGHTTAYPAVSVAPNTRSSRPRPVHAHQLMDAPAAPTRLTLAVLGDSVPAAAACRCPGFADLFGRQIAATSHAAVTIDNLGTPGQTSRDLLASLAVGEPAAQVVARADIVTITIGANDFDYNDYSPSTCPALTCYTSALQRMHGGVDAALSEIASLRASRPTAVRVTGYWDIWKDGAVGRAEGEQYGEVGDQLTRKVNAALADAAAAHDAVFIDLFDAFRGHDGTDDDTHLLASDGDHPNSVGHTRIASALLKAGLHPLR